MSIFNSLGSNYTGGTLRRLFAPASSQNGQKLQQYLVDHYEATDVQVTYKCREAITLGLRQLDLPAGSRVAINGFTCYAVYEAIVAAGLLPHYVDITRTDLNYTAAALGKAIKAEPTIRVAMIQNTFGIPSDVAAIAKVCAAHNVVLVEDLAHSAGLQYADGQEAGTVGQWAALSFSQDKMIDAVSGGALVSKQSIPAVTPKTLSFKKRAAARWYPLSTWVIRGTFGIGVGRALLKAMKHLQLIPRPMAGSAGTVHKLSNWSSREALLSQQDLVRSSVLRKAIASIYSQQLPKDVQFAAESGAVHLRYPILVSDRDSLLKFLGKERIYLSDTWYDAAIGPKQYQHLTDYNGQCPESEYVAEHIVNLPTHQHVTEAKAAVIAEKVNAWLKSVPK